MNLNRSSGVLLHPSALPNQSGIGDFGSEAYNFIDFLVELKQAYWQILPLTIPEKGNSPYSPLSSFAGNPLLISLDELVKDNLLEASDLQNISKFSENINFSIVKEEKEYLLRKAFSNFSPISQEYKNFCHHHWLEDYALFISLYEKHGKRSWDQWSKQERNPDQEEKRQLIREHKEEIGYHKFVQFIFFQQWTKLKDYANQHKIQIIGDIPIYVSYNSADVWANKNLFQLDDNAQPQYISGCPPDDFNHDGQIWENPLYDWEVNQQTNYQWWQERIRYNLQICDVLRLDHFIGFTRYWSIPTDLYDAKQGQWKEGPGKAFFQVLGDSIPNLNLIAEDLGSLTQEVTDLKDEFNFPGMIVLQYAIDDYEFNKANYPHKTFIYTGTHDNNTSKGWWKEYAHSNDLIKDNLVTYLTQLRDNHDFIIDQETITYDLIEIAYASNCLVAVVPMQDILNLDQEYRMNRPGVATGNWGIRLPQDYLSLVDTSKILALLRKYLRDINS